MKYFTLIPALLGAALLTSCGDSAMKQAATYFEGCLTGTADSLFVSDITLRPDHVA